MHLMAHRAPMHLFALVVVLGGCGMHRVASTGNDQRDGHWNRVGRAIAGIGIAA